MLKKILLQTLMISAAASLAVSQADGQTAFYPLDVDATDTTSNQYDASLVGTTSFVADGSRNVLKLPENDGVLLLPATLSSRFNDNSFFEIRLDFKVFPNTGGQQLRPLVQMRTPCGDWTPRCPGLGVFFWGTEDPSTQLIVINFADGRKGDFPNHPANGSHDNIKWLGNVTLNEWHSARFLVDFTYGAWRLIIDDIKYSGFVSDPLEDYKYDLEAIKSHITSNPIVIGNNGEIPYRGGEQEMWIDNLAVYNSMPETNILDLPLTEMTSVVNGSLSLSESEKQERYEIIDANLFGNFLFSKEAILGYIEAFEAANEPLFSDFTGVLLSSLSYEDQLANLLYMDIIQYQFFNGRLNNVEGVKFEAREVFPGTSSVSQPRIASAFVDLNGSYNKNIAFILTMDEFVVRPAGYWVPAGEKVTLVFDNAAVDQGLSVIVGAHFRNLTADLGVQNRIADISTEFTVDQSVIEVANPFGGGIYLKVPTGTNVGWTTVEIQNAIKSAYYSHREGRQTDVSDWIEQVTTTTAPWVDMESDQYMFTMPLQFATDVTNPDAIMARWDSIMTNIKELAGRTEPRARAEYFLRDRKLVTPAYGAGYPMVIGPGDLPDIPHPLEVAQGTWDPFSVLEHRPNYILFHEMGHNLLHPHMYFDDNNHSNGETIVHVHGFKVYNTIYGMSLDDAFGKSAFQGLTIDQAAIDWITTHNFRHDLSMGFDPTIDPGINELNDQIRYQHRGFAVYADLAKLFGWDAVGAINGRFYTSGDAPDGLNPRVPHVYTRERFVEEACAALNLNMAPLFHFWGIKISDDLQADLASRFPKSLKIKSLLEDYLSIVPRNNAEFMVWYDLWYGLVGEVQQPRYDYLKANFTEETGDSIAAQVQQILDLYDLQGLFVTKPIIDIVANEDFGTMMVAALDSVFENPDLPNDSLAYTVSVTSGLITADISGDSLQIYSVDDQNGMTEVIVTATNDSSASVSNKFTVTILPIVSVEDELAGIPDEYDLYQNYPNPFNPTTVLRYALPKSSNVSLVIYNLSGQEVMRWDEDNISPGYYEKFWRGTNISGNHVSSGIYIYRILAGDFVQTRKMVFLK